MEIKYRKAKAKDLMAVVRFVDYWLTGGAVKDKVSGATHDFFIPAGRQLAYLRKYTVLVATCERVIVGYAVMTRRRVLIHLLVAVPMRGRGIGSELLRILDPEIVRSKMDQKSGNPAEFYAKAGYTPMCGELIGRKANIEMFMKVTEDSQRNSENSPCQS